MTAGVRRRSHGSDHYRLKTTSTTATSAVVIVAVVAAVAVAAARATITFESGETATEPPDDTVYMIEEVAAWNVTAAAAGDYDYDYDSSTADALQMPHGHYSSIPDKTVAPRVDASTVAPAATITVLMPAATVTEVPVTNATTTTATTAATAVSDTTAVYSTTTTVVRPSTSETTVVTATDAATFRTAATESGVSIQIASPLGYGVTNVTTVITTPAPATPNSSAPLLLCRRWTATLMLSLVFVATVAS